MNRSRDELLLAFLEGELSDPERASLLDQIESDPELADAVRAAARGMAAVRFIHDVGTSAAPAQREAARARRISPWWAVAAAVATLLISVPATLQLRPGSPGGTAATVVAQPVSPEPSFVLVLLGRWPDAAGLEQVEVRRRADEYWAWASSLAEDGLLVAAGDLRWEPGERLAAGGEPVSVGADVVDDPNYIVGMFTIRVDGYDDAVTLARDCPHLRYGGSVSVRRVAGGFVTVPGMGDRTD